MSASAFHQCLRAVGVIALVAGIPGALFGLWSLIDPSIIPQSGPAGSSGMPPSRLRSALLLVFSLAAAVYGARMTFPDRMP